MKKPYINLPEISVIIPTLDAGSNLTSCLKSIWKLNFPKKSLEVIIIDNGNNTNKILNVKYDNESIKLKIIENKRNYGFAKAINQGAKTAKGEYLFITNDDVILDKDCLLNLITYLKENPDIGIAGPGGHLGAMNYNFWLGRFYESKYKNKTQEADWIPGYGLMIKKSLFNKLGCFDENYFFTGEDLDLAVKAKKLGYRVIYHPKAQLTHIYGATVNKPENLGIKYFEGYKSKWRLILKHANFFQIISALSLQIIVYMPIRGILMKEKSAIPLIRALIWNFKNYGH